MNEINQGDTHRTIDRVARESYAVVRWPMCACARTIWRALGSRLPYRTEDPASNFVSFTRSTANRMNATTSACRFISSP